MSSIRKCKECGFILGTRPEVSEVACVVAVSGGKNSCSIVSRLIDNRGVKTPLWVKIANG